jgi:hypothetical protein
MTQTRLDPPWFLLAFAPWIYLVVAAFFAQGLRCQDRVARAGSSAAFRSAVEGAGGGSSVRSGLWLDAAFIVTFGLTACLLLALSVPVLAPLPALVAALDLTEGFVIARFLSEAPTDQAAQRLQVLAVCKLVGYGVTILALVVAWARSRS